VTERGPRRLLIASRNLALLHAHYEDVIVALVRAGVQVSVRYVNEKGLRADDYQETLLRRDCEISAKPLPHPGRVPGDLLGLRLRQLANLLRYYHRDYRGRAGLRQTRFEKALPGPRRWARRLGRLGSRMAALGIRLGSDVDRVLPPSEAAQALLAEEQPDAVVAADVIRGPGLVDLLKAAAWEGLPTASWVQSWDNLSSGGLLHFTSDRVFVWNTVQRDELARYHGIPERHVCVTGAQTFDYWFNGDSPSRRADFCAQNGLDAKRPIILYLASSRLAEESPADFFLRWLDALRSCGDPAVETAGVLVRPHPTNVQPWLGLEQRFEGTAVSPTITAAPINSSAYRTRFRDELHHASVAVALNTTAMIDAAIFGKPVCTIELPELTKGQRGTVHFEYLMTIEEGFVRTAATLDEHVAMLGELVRRDPSERDERSDRFVQAFVRPHGLDVTPADVFSEEMLRLLESPSEVRLPRSVGRTIGRLVHRSAPVLGAPLEDQPLRRWVRKRRRHLPTTGAGKRLAPQRARVKRVRRFFRVRLPAAVRARVLRLLRHRKPAGSTRAQASERQS
jgi:hypothetical protein